MSEHSQRLSFPTVYLLMPETSILYTEINITSFSTIKRHSERNPSQLFQNAQNQYSLKVSNQCDRFDI